MTNVVLPPGSLSGPPARKPVGGLLPDADAALAPVRAALLDRAHEDATRVRADGEAAATQMLAAARRQADRILAKAKEAGAADGREIADAERARRQREARAVVLAAQRSIYDELVRRSRTAAERWRRDPQYAAQLSAVMRSLRDRLGAGTEVAEDPSGGAVAERPGVRVDYSIDTLVTRAIGNLGEEVQALWSP